MHSRSIVISLITAALVVLAGCSSDDSDASPEPGETPADWTPTTVDGVSLATPPDWETFSGDNARLGGTTHYFMAGDDEHGNQPGVQVTRVAQPGESAEAALDTVEEGVRGEAAISDVEREEPEWAGADDAHLLSFVAEDGPADYLNKYLILSLAGGEQVHVVATASVDDYDELQLDDVLATVAVQ